MIYAMKILLTETVCRNDMMSMALLLHIGSGSEIVEIQIDHLEKAIAWGGYLKSHAKRVYGSKYHLATLLLNKIILGKLSNPFVIRDVKRAQWQELTDDHSVDTAISVLLDHEYVRVTRTPTGGKPRVEYHVNPKFLKKYYKRLTLLT